MVPFSSASSPVYLLGGLTGSGKTELLYHLHNAGQQVLNLEELCCHDGSAFARLRYASQPSSYRFHKELNKRWQSFDSNHPVFIEHELQKIGNLSLPGWLYQRMLAAPVIWLDAEKALRVQQLSERIRCSDPLLFCECLHKLKGRLGAQSVAEITAYFAAGDVERSVELLLGYYDNSEGYTQPAEERIILRLKIDQPDRKRYCDILLRELAP
ncbi:MAG: hypothetical protein KF862_15140 [Chitinophagaceae bacterium]|nr:hypothetical protein [Chitinophagaceae bacterium]